uniref:enoyl-CoA hydratase-related protein n=1 Tax=Chelativorans sp. Marseille-P2723 TaxID=2709133 RepID=UPI0015700B12
ADARALAGLMRKLDGSSKTTIAAVQGAAFGGGVGLVACCDIAIGALGAKFALSEVRLGLIPAAISPFVIAAIGARVARRYFQTAEIFGAEEARRIGLLHEVVPDDQLQSRVEALLAALDKTAPGARMAAKQLVCDVALRPITDELTDFTAGRIANIRAGEEAAEGLAAFFARRPPNWTARGDAQ